MPARSTRSLGCDFSDHALKLLPDCTELSHHCEIAQQVLLIETCWACNGQPSILKDGNLVVVSEASIWRTILVGLLPCLPHDLGVGRHGFLFNEGCSGCLDVHFCYIHKGEGIGRNMEKNEARIDVEITAVGVLKVRHPPLGFDKVA